MSIKIKIGKVLFYVFWGIVIIGKGLGYTSDNPAFQNMTWIAIFFAFLKIINSKYNKNTIIVCVLLNCIGLLIWLFSGTTTVLLATITITAMENIYCRCVYKFSFWILGSMFVLRTTLAILGVFDIQQLYFFSNDRVRVRYALGYGQPNATHFMLFIVIVLCVLVYSNRLKIHHYLLLLIYNYFIYSYTNSRAGFFVNSIFILLCLGGSFESVKRILYKFLKFWSNKAFIITSVASIAITQLFIRIDILRLWGTFSSRFSTAFSVMEKNSITLFGVPGITTDFGMINFLYSDGLIFFILFVAAYYFLLKKYNRQKDLYFMIACCCYAIYCLAESYADSVLMNVTLLMFGEFIYNKKLSPIENAKEQFTRIDKNHRDLTFMREYENYYGKEY